MFGNIINLKTFLFMIFIIVLFFHWVKVFQTILPCRKQIPKMRQLTILIFIYYLIYWGTLKEFHKTVQHLINNTLSLKSNWFDLKLKILNLDWRQEIIIIAFWKYYFMWHTQNIFWEIFNFPQYFVNMYPFFHKHFLLI